MPHRTAALACCALPLGLPLWAAAQTGDPSLRPVVITGATAGEQRWTAPASIDVVDGDELRAGQLQINLSEGLGRVPGLSISNRQNYAQDLQLSIRGFGARSTFGVRGVRLYVDGIPASAPDGQGQAANFPIGAADRIEVIRGPYSALYGGSAGGVVALYTADGGAPDWRAGLAGGANGLWRASTHARGRAGAYHFDVDVSAFGTQGPRPQSAARRDTAHLKLARPYDGGRLVLVANRQVSQAQDPLGLSRAEFDTNPYQTTPVALQFNTRKSVRQTQLGLAWTHGLGRWGGGGHSLHLMGYAGERSLVQYQSIPPSAQTALSAAGGVIDLGRAFGGLNARWRLDRRHEAGRLTATAGVAWDRQDEDRRGFENFQGATLGVMGRLRRDEANRAESLDPYAQVEWDTDDWTFTAGMRRARVRLSSADRYIAPGNPDDSGAVRHAATLPVLGLRWKLSRQVQAYASAGRGFETPTLNEAAYRTGGAAGLNTALDASRSRSVEAGLRGRHGNAAWTATVFDVRTRDEIVVLSNSGGRSIFQNAGRTRRRGVELSGEAQWGPLNLASALTLIDARHADGFLTCAGTPCATPTLAIAAGNRIPGIARRQAYVKATWEPGQRQAAVPTVTLELRHHAAVPVNDSNSDAAPGYTVGALGLRWQQQSGPWQWRQFLRIDNLTDRRHAGSVIVNEGNGRYFETAAGRSLFVGMELVRHFD